MFISGAWDGSNQVVKVCGLLYYGASRLAADDLYCYHFWDFDCDHCKSTFSLPASEIVSIELAEERFVSQIL